MLLDCHLPKMDGIATAMRIRELGRTAGFERLGKLPLIGCTADGTQERRAACLIAGIDDYIVKPFHQSDILRTLTHWLDRTPRRPMVDRETIVDAANIFRARRAS